MPIFQKSILVTSAKPFHGPAGCGLYTERLRGTRDRKKVLSGKFEM